MPLILIAAQQLILLIKMLKVQKRSTQYLTAYRIKKVNTKSCIRNEFSTLIEGI
jgi:hypothetical protein